MALTLFVPPYNPTVSGTTVEVAVRARTVQFGDGYEQRAEDGINTRPRSGRWYWAGLTDEEADDLVDFLETYALIGFRYTFPAELTERNYKVTGSMSRSYLPGGLQSLSVDVKEIFDPV